MNGGYNTVRFDLNGNENQFKTSNFLHQNNSKSGLKGKVRMDSGNLHWLLHRKFITCEYETCEKIIEHQMIATNDHEYLYFVRGLITKEKGKYQEALKHFNTTIEFGSKNPLYFKEIGKTLFLMGKYNQSLEMFLKAESFLQSPDHEIYHFIGKLMSLNTKHQTKTSSTTNTNTTNDAKEYFKRAIMSGHQLESYKELAMMYRREKDFHKSIELLESCLTSYPSNVEVMTDLGILFLKLNDTELAYDKLHNVVTVDHGTTESLLALGAILQTKNDVEGALNTYKNIQNIQSEGFELWNNIGMCFYRKNKLIAAISCLKKALWLSPLCFNSLYNLGVVLMTAQQFASAFQCFVSAVSMKPENAESFMMLAICLYYLNDLENAKIAFHKAILSSAAIKNPLIYLNYSIFSMECIRDYGEAQQYLNNFYNLCDTMKVPQEFIQIAEIVISRLPTSNLTQLSETRNMPKELRETKIISKVEEIKTETENKSEEIKNEAETELTNPEEDDGDLV